MSIFLIKIFFSFFSVQILKILTYFIKLLKKWINQTSAVIIHYIFLYLPMFDLVIFFGLKTLYFKEKDNMTY